MDFKNKEHIFGKTIELKIDKSIYGAGFNEVAKVIGYHSLKDLDNNSIDLITIEGEDISLVIGPDAKLYQYDFEEFKLKELNIDNILDLDNYIDEISNLEYDYDDKKWFLDRFRDIYKENFHQKLGFDSDKEMFKNSLRYSFSEETNTLGRFYEIHKYITICKDGKIILWENNDGEYHVIESNLENKKDVLNFLKYNEPLFKEKEVNDFFEKNEEIIYNHQDLIKDYVQKNKENDPFDLKIITDTFEKIKEPDFGMGR